MVIDIRTGFGTHEEKGSGRPGACEGFRVDLDSCTFNGDPTAFVEGSLQDFKIVELV